MMPQHVVQAPCCGAHFFVMLVDDDLDLAVAIGPLIPVETYLTLMFALVASTYLKEK